MDQLGERPDIDAFIQQAIKDRMKPDQIIVALEDEFGLNHFTATLKVDKMLKEGIFKPGDRTPGGIRLIQCPTCHGMGTKSKTTNIPCPTCHGAKKVINTKRVEDDPVKISEIIRQIEENQELMYCPTCKENVEPELSNIGGFKCPSCGNLKLQPPIDEMSSVGAIGGFNAPMKKKESLSLRSIIREAETENPGHGEFKWAKRGKDLSNKPDSITHWISQVSKSGDLQKQFGTNYDPQKFISWLETQLSDFIGHGISKEYFSKLKSQLESIGKNSQKAMSYVYNTFLKGAGWGLRENR